MLFRDGGAQGSCRVLCGDAPVALFGGGAKTAISSSNPRFTRILESERGEQRSGGVPWEGREGRSPCQLSADSHASSSLSYAERIRSKDSVSISLNYRSRDYTSK